MTGSDGGAPTTVGAGDAPGAPVGPGRHDHAAVVPLREGSAPDYDAAFASLYRLAYQVAYRILGRRDEAEDVAQEALSRAFLRWQQASAAPEAWVSRVSANRALDVVRWEQRRQRLGWIGRVASAVTGPSARAGGHADEVVQRADVQRVLERLPRRQREVVVLRYLADLSEIDAAAALGCSVGSVKTHASRGLAALKVALGAEPAGEV